MLKLFKLNKHNNPETQHILEAYKELALLLDSDCGITFNQLLLYKAIKDMPQDNVTESIKYENASVWKDYNGNSSQSEKIALGLIILIETGYVEVVNA
jgi:hypothetical protein